MTEQVPATTPAVQTPAAAPAANAAVAPTSGNPEKQASEARSIWLKQAAQEIGVTQADVDDVTPAKETAVRGKDGKFLPKKDKAEAKPKTEEASSDTESAKQDTHDTIPAKETPAETKTEETPDEAQKELIQARTEVQNAWTKVNREMARLRQQSEQLKTVRSEFERLQKLETRLKTEPYKVVEEVGGSLSDWQRRSLTGGDNPQIQDIRQAIAERDAAWQKRFDDIQQAAIAEKQKEKVQATEQNFIAALDAQASQSEVCKAHGKGPAVDMAYDFAEHVARTLRGRGDVPRSEKPFIDEYLKNTPRALALNPENLVRVVERRLARQKVEDAQQEQEVQENKPKQKSKTVDNAASTQRAAPTQAKSRAEWLKEAAAQIRVSEDAIDD
jgi:hypothetical protein